MDPRDLLPRVAAVRREPKAVVRRQDAVGVESPHIELGTYTCDQIPGSLRLTRSAGTLHLWRRGTRDQLTQAGPATYTGNGYTLTLNGTADRADQFSLDLDRAPGLAYVRR
ncbi:hypothetical protein [Streptomyces sp. NPDC102264]|uniref:hypothetical protein n=1 Tax=Streptomyces sp. NPDC102264 TaxID=3366149 RepID=UPI00381809B3